MKYLKKFNDWANNHQDALLIVSGVTMLWAAYRYNHDMNAWQKYANGLKITSGDVYTRDDGVMVMLLTLGNGEVVNLYKNLELPAA